MLRSSECWSEHIPPQCCLKVLLALANNVTTPSASWYKAAFVLFAFSLLIIAAMVYSLLDDAFNTWDHYRVRMSVSYQQPLSPSLRSIRSPPESASNAKSRQCLGAQDLQVHSPHDALYISSYKRCSRQPYHCLPMNADHPKHKRLNIETVCRQLPRQR
jgi:hypothetical protein